MTVQNRIKAISGAIFIIFCIACSSEKSKENQQKDSLAKDSTLQVSSQSKPLPKEELKIEDGKHIISAKDTLYLGDTLTIKFKTPHPKDFAIFDPDDKFFFLVFAGNDSQKPSLTDWNKFENMSEIALITNHTKANPWDSGKKENELIFTKSGKYKIVLSHNLETDDGTPSETAYVYYVNSLKKGTSRKE